MKLYSDVFSGTEIISDAYKFVEEYDGVVVKVKGRFVVKGDDNVDIGCGNAFGGSGEEQQGGAPQEKVVDIIDSFQYQEFAFTFKDYLAYFKGYMGKVLKYLKEKQPERVDTFKKGAQAYFAWLKSRTEQEESDPQFTYYTPKDYDSDNTLIISEYIGEDDAPTFYYMIDGLKGEKY